jgi:hypothetical protein
MARVTVVSTEDPDAREMTEAMLGVGIATSSIVRNQTLIGRSLREASGSAAFGFAEAIANLKKELARAEKEADKVKGPQLALQTVEVELLCEFRKSATREGSLEVMVLAGKIDDRRETALTHRVRLVFGAPPGAPPRLYAKGSH